MTKRPAYQILYAPEALSHLHGLRARERVIVLDNVLRQLSHEPRSPTRNRKVLRANELAPYELRIGDLRVYYHVMEPEGGEVVVLVVAVGVKVRSRVRIGGEEVDL